MKYDIALLKIEVKTVDLEEHLLEPLINCYVKLSLKQYECFKRNFSKIKSLQYDTKVVFSGKFVELHKEVDIEQIVWNEYRTTGCSYKHLSEKYNIVMHKIKKIIDSNINKLMYHGAGF
jgi:hypothetical protein